MIKTNDAQRFIGTFSQEWSHSYEHAIYQGDNSGITMPIKYTQGAIQGVGPFLTHSSIHLQTTCSDQHLQAL